MTPSISPVPGSSSTTEQPSNTTEAATAWRAPVTQAYRSSEVREIAKVLASLEPGATSSSKLMLAMRFEAAIFSAATSLADYRKKLSKRLKKLQKNYVPPPRLTATNNASGDDPNAVASSLATGGEAAAAADVEQQILALRRKFGKALALIDKNAVLAFVAMREKSGPERANHLQQHIDNARQWADQLGVLPNSDPKKIPKLNDAELERLKSHLEQRVENIRSHVVKLTEPDLFLEERLEEIDMAWSNPQTSRLLSEAVSQRFVSLGWKEFNDPKATLQQALDKAAQTVPPPSRDPRSKTNAALAHLDALRAASQALLAFVAISDNSAVDFPTKVLSKSHIRAIQATRFLKEEWPSINPIDEGKKAGVTLEDAWVKVMELPGQDDVADMLAIGHSVDAAPPPSKRLRPTVIRSKVLLRPGRACPSNLLLAFKRKGARLVQPCSDCSYLILDFEAFDMTIYLVPLVVKITAKRKKASSSLSSEPSSISVWGVTGTWETLGEVVQDRIDHASAQATRVLRHCFEAGAAAGTGQSRVADFEVEISEGTALLKFLQLARLTYMPDWQDVDV